MKKDYYVMIPGRWMGGQLIRYYQLAHAREKAKSLVREKRKSVKILEVVETVDLAFEIKEEKNND